MEIIIGLSVLCVCLLGFCIWITRRDAAEIAKKEANIKVVDEILKSAREANAEKNKVTRMSDAAVHDELLKQWRRD